MKNMVLPPDFPNPFSITGINWGAGWVKDRVIFVFYQPFKTSAVGPATGHMTGPSRPDVTFTYSPVTLW